MDVRALKPGHPVYDRLRQEWLAEWNAEEQDVLASLDEWIGDMARNSRANDLELGRLRILPDGSELRLSEEAWEREQAEAGVERESYENDD